MGVATSTATFFRSVGGSFGVAIFGAIFASRLADEIRKLPPDIARQLAAGVHLTPGAGEAAARRRSTTPSSTPSPTRSTASSSGGCSIALIPFGLSWLLKEVPLRTTVRAHEDDGHLSSTTGQ